MNEHVLDPRWLEDVNRAFNNCFAVNHHFDRQLQESRLAELRVKYLADAHGDQWKSYVIESVFRERMFSIANASSCTAAECANAFHEITKIGFRTLFAEATITVILARRWASEGRLDEATKLLTHIDQRLTDSINSHVAQRELARETLAEIS